MTSYNTFQDRPSGPSFDDRTGAAWEKGSLGLIPADLTCRPVVDVASLTQTHNLVVFDLACGQLVDTASLTQVHNLALADLACEAAVDVAALTQVHNLTVSDLACGCTIEDVTITGNGGAVFADRAGGPSFSDRTGTTWRKALSLSISFAVLAAMFSPRTMSITPGRTSGRAQKRRLYHG
jgi:hypothetical protein